MILNIFKEYKLAFIATFSSLFLLFLYASFYPNADEAVHYSSLACNKYPLSSYHIFTEACGKFDLKIFGTWLPIRSFLYSGSLLSYILFSPLHSIFNNYTVLFIYQFLFFCAIVFFTHKLLRASIWLISAVFSTCFPFYFQIIHDTGPVAYHILTFVLFPYLILKTSLSSSYIKKSLYLILSGIVLFLAIEQKFFYLVLIPIPYLFTLLYFYHEKRIDKKLFVYFTISASITVILTGILLNAETREGSKYFTQIIGMQNNYDAPNFIDRMVSYIGYLISFQKFSHRIFAIFPTFWDYFLSIIYFLLILFISIYIKYIDKYKQKMDQSLFLYLFILFVITSVLVCVPKLVWAGHHFVFPIFFLLLLFIVALNKIRQSFNIIFCIIIISLSISIYSIVSHQKNIWQIPDFVSINHYSLDVSRKKVVETILTKNIQNENIIVHIDIGIYYIDALFGPKNQIIIWLFHEFNSQTLLDIQQKAQKINRGVIFIGRKDDIHKWKQIKEIFPNILLLNYSEGDFFCVYRAK